MIASKRPSVRAAPAQAKRCVALQARQDRRAVLGSLLAGVAMLPAGEAVAADNTAGPVDLFDDRKVRKSGFDVIYEARDLDLTQNERDGLSQYRGDLSATKKRYQESISRIQDKVPGYINKQYWTEAREELRRQVGFFRFDLRNLAASRGTKDQRKEGLDKAKNLVKATERLDFALSQKKKDVALENYDVVLEKLKDFNSFAAA